MKAKRMLLDILTSLAGVIVVFLIVVATRPADIRVARTLGVVAPPDAVFLDLNEL